MKFLYMSQGWALLAIITSKFILVDNPFVFFFQISLLDECGFFERALDELHKKEPKIVSGLVNAISLGFSLN